MTGADAMAAGDVLAHALEVLADRGLRTPCQMDPEAWFAEHRSAQAQAIEACGHCPLLEPCREYTEVTRPTHGVWAGVLRSDRPGPKPRTDDQPAHDEGAAA